MTSTTLHRFIDIGKPVRCLLEMTARAVCMEGFGNRTGCMAAETGVVFYLQVFVMLHHIRLKIVIMALAASDRSAFTFLNTGMTASA